MPWLELLVPVLVVLLAMPSVAVAYVYARSSKAAWGSSLFGFLASAAGVSLLTALGIFLRASGIVRSYELYFIVWNLSFAVLALASWFAIRTALRVVKSAATGRVRRLFALGSALAYAGTLALAIRGRGDLYFPYIGGTYAATSLYLFASLGCALSIVVKRRARLAPEDECTLQRFLRIFLPLGAAFFFDELCRATSLLRLPWLPLLPLAPLALYLFAGSELLLRLRRPAENPTVRAPAAAAEEQALAIARGCGASPLTAREREVLVELLRGASNSDIASSLNISPNTVKNHIYSIFQKTGAGSRSELFLFAARGVQGSDSR